MVVLANLVARDVRTTTGANLHFVRELTGLDPWQCSPKDVKAVMAEKQAELPDQDRWRVPYMGRLLEERGERFHSMEDTKEITELIDSLCTRDKIRSVSCRISRPTRSIVFIAKFLGCPGNMTVCKDREQELFGAALIFIPTCGGAARLSLSNSDSEFSFLEFFHF